MDDLFTSPDQVETEETLRVHLTQKWKEKFPTADEELIRSKVDSDLYIKTLEKQKDELRADYLKSQEEIQKGKALEALIDRLNQKENPPALPNQPVIETPQPKGLDEASLETWYENKKRTELENENFRTVQSKLQERFGTRAGEYLAEQAQSLGLTKEEVNSLAKKSPEAFYRTMGITQGQDLFNAPPRSDVRNDSFAPKTQKRTWSFYQDMKAKDPAKYWDPKTQLQMHRDSEQLGSAFEDGDYSY